MEDNTTIALIHPSRGRPDKARVAYHEWLNNADNDFEYVISIDSSDPKQALYFQLFGEGDDEIIQNPNRSIVDAVNVACSQIVADIYVVMSDDFGCPKGWDTIIKQAMPLDRPAVIQVRDTIQDEIVTLPIMNRLMYEKLGYVYHPRYFSMFADNDLTECAKIHGELIKLDVVFEHRHYVNKKSPMDATYERENSQKAWDIGKKFFEMRKRTGFKLG
jgi:glycosyltransferase involved in cell wall biosynthesis